MVVEILLGFVTLLFGTSCYVVWNTTKKVEIMEDWISSFMTRIIEINNKVMKDFNSTFLAEIENVYASDVKTIKEQMDMLLI